MKKIGLYLSVGPHSGGSFQYCLSVIENLSFLDKKKYKIIAFITNKIWKEHLPKNFIIIKINKNNRIERYLNYLSLIIFSKKLYKYLCNFLSPQINLLNRNKCDLIIFPSQEEFSSKIYTKSISVIHDLMHRYEPQFKEYSFFERIRRDYLYKKICKNSHGVIVDSEIGKKHVKESYKIDKGKIFICQFEVPEYLKTSKIIDIFKKYNLPKKKYIFYPSQFWEHKNHINLIRAFNMVKNKIKNINPELIEEKISKKTKAILVVDIFGHPADYKKIFLIAKKYRIKVISDSAQSIGSKYYKKFSGTFADIGGFSFNCHKHINTGEGGVIVTNNKKIANKLRLIRNHAESSIDQKNMNKKNLINMIGYNFRLGEIESAIGIEQIKKLNKILTIRKRFANLLSKNLSNLDGLKLPVVKKGCSHSFYTYPMILDLKKIGVNREVIYKALKAEGVKISKGYQNLHLLPIFKNKIAYGKSGYPWKFSKKKFVYKKNSCPVAEELHSKTFIHLSMYTFNYKERDIKNIVKAFHKVWGNLNKLRKLK